ncbi:LOG family protein [Knoellia sp. p5-6-4]|uniref:LOG family protein n=1 Tax=unclassified Knoellia TaxID=2618719 RepID=UPI0023DBE4E1|nr:LOG family protein [Knoellia sp. p5-6-4]MDF2143959.1 LOG family protein [Knoellia sp. p5-6-4]
MSDPHPVTARRHPADNEIESLHALEDALARRIPLCGLRLQDLDLTGHEEELLARTDVEGMVVLGGRLPPALEVHLREHGALIFPTDPHAPVNPYRATPYQPHELYAGLAEQGYDKTPDALAYTWSRDARLHHDAFVTLLRAIHDDSMTDALTEFIGHRPVVGVMGGHALARGTDGYAEAARLGHILAAEGLVVATGGGPGAMEAANLGAFCADTNRLEDALGRLAAVPSFSPDIAPWARVALQLHDELMESGRPRAVSSVGIPTWFYGHEPPNVFCDGIGKYFSNAIREDGLLARCTAGLVVLPGAAGTAQEVFQAATRLYYAPAGSVLPPMVLVGVRHWTETVPVWAGLTALAAGRDMEQALHLVDDIDEVPRLLHG